MNQEQNDVARWPLACIAIAFILYAAALGAAEPAARPNVIVLLADDLGWNGLSCYGSDLHQTPNLDRLAAEGTKFTDAYAACTVCSPTRAALMTGMYPARLHLTDWITGQKRPKAKLKIPDWTMQLEHHHVTLAEALQAAGYATAHVGKWHLGGPDFYPEKQGFDVNVGGSARGGPAGGYFLPNKMDLPKARRGEYLTDHLTDRAVEIIHQWKDRPFFLYFPYYVVHTPIQGKQEYADRYAARVTPKSRHKNATYAAMHQSLDESVGRIVAALGEAGIADRTAIFFSSDNGGLSYRHGKGTGITDNFPLRRGKGSAYEGGVRVPLIVKWPGATKAGSTFRQPVTTPDLYPTILQIAGAVGNAKHNSNVDGVSLTAVLKDSRAKLDRGAIFWHYPHYHAGGDNLPGKPTNGPYAAVRSGDWKLIEFFEDQRAELYNLTEDIGEQNDLARKMPDKTRALRAMLHQWQESVGAQLPTPNPNYEPQNEN